MGYRYDEAMDAEPAYPFGYGPSYTVAVGSSSRDIRERASFEIPGERVVRQVENRLTPAARVNELKPR